MDQLGKHLVKPNLSINNRQEALTVCRMLRYLTVWLLEDGNCRHGLLVKIIPQRMINHGKTTKTFRVPGGYQAFLEGNLMRESPTLNHIGYWADFSIVPDNNVGYCGLEHRAVGVLSSSSAKLTLCKSLWIIRQATNSATSEAIQAYWVNSQWCCRLVEEITRMPEKCKPYVETSTGVWKEHWHYIFHQQERQQICIMYW